MLRERVLDLGIGGEQSYTLNEGDKILRVGADIKLDALQATRLFNLENQTLLDAKYNLPFSTESFDRIQIFFPDGSLLESLCNQESTKGAQPLWPELGRILRTGGIVELFLDEHKILPFSTDVYDDSGKQRHIFSPHIKAERAAKKYGFIVRAEQLFEEKIEGLESLSALIFARIGRVYFISATKPN